MVNNPPSKGKLSVSPTFGSEVSTIFTMSASQWFDSDLPLQYAFGFVTSTGALSMLPRSPLAYGSTILPAGQDTSGFLIPCQLQVFDSYLAYSSVNLTVTVRKSNIAPDVLFSKGEASHYYSFPRIFSVVFFFATLFSYFFFLPSFLPFLLPPLTTCLDFLSNYFRILVQFKPLSATASLPVPPPSSQLPPHPS